MGANQASYVQIYRQPPEKSLFQAVFKGFIAFHHLRREFPAPGIRHSRRPFANKDLPVTLGYTTGNQHKVTPFRKFYYA